MLSWIKRLTGRLSVEEQRILVALAHGWTLKSHRYLDGTKEYKLWRPDGRAEPVAYQLPQTLLNAKYITTNQKFPAATFLLTNKGKSFVADLDLTVQGIADIVHFE